MANYDKRWFNPLFFIIRELVNIPTISTILIYGGKSSSKTISIAQELVIRCHDEKASALAFRKYSVDIPITLKKSFALVVDKLYLYPNFDKLDRKFNCYNKAEIVFKGIDDAEKAKGVESYKYILLDELNQFSKDEYEQFQLSLRGQEGQKIFGTWNPVDENNWVKTDLVDKHTWVNSEYKLPCENSFVKISTCGTNVLIKTTYEDNYWIYGRPDGDHGEKNEFGFRDESLIARYNAMMYSNANSYKVNVLGEWGKTVFGGEFLKGWKTEIHTGNYPYNPIFPVHLIFDENVNPYFPCAIMQVNHNMKEFQMVDCISLEHPENTTSKMCSEIIRKLKYWNHKEDVFIGGDPTSQKDDVKQEKGYDLFTIIMTALKEFKPRRATLSGSPSVKMSKDFVNDILEHETQGLKFRADKNCRRAIIDFENTKEDKNGKVDKKLVTNPVTKVGYQPYGHYCDILRYFVCYVFMIEYDKYQYGQSSFENVVKVSRTTRNGF